MSNRAKFTAGAMVCVREKVEFFKGARGPVVVAVKLPHGWDVIVDIPGEGPLHFAAHELEPVPAGGDPT